MDGAPSRLSKTAPPFDDAVNLHIVVLIECVRRNKGIENKDINLAFSDLAFQIREYLLVNVAIDFSAGGQEGVVGSGVHEQPVADVTRTNRMMQSRRLYAPRELVFGLLQVPQPYPLRTAMNDLV